MTATCTAINAALQRKGLNNTQLASQTGLSASRVDAILSGSSKATQQEFNSIANVLGLTGNPQNADHATA